MPWQKRTEMSLRYDFIVACQERNVSMRELCHSFGISRKTGYKWLKRFEINGCDGLVDLRSNRPKRSGLFTDDIWEEIFSCRTRNPTYGPRKLVKMLCLQHPTLEWPSISRVKQRLKEKGLSVPRIRRRRVVTERLPLRAITAPNDVWCIDLKGWFTTKDKKRCEPLTLMDGYSRYLFICEPMERPRYTTVKPVLEETFYKYGKPQAIRSDNGPPFGSTGLRGLTPLSVWLLKHGIWPEKIAPGNPGQNGRLERLHKTLKADALQDFCYYAEYVEKMKNFVNQYNTLRPHESLEDLPPQLVYTKSSREYHPDKVEEYEYPAGYTMYRVSSDGYLQLPNERIYLSESLAKEHVGVGNRELGEPIIFLGYNLGALDEHRKRVGSPNVKKQS